jgi:uncharacterized membrane protein
VERMLVVMFDSEAKAYEGSRALYQLDQEGTISIYAEAVISKQADGKLNIKQADGDFPIRTLAGTSIGSLLGLLGGPLGIGIGAATGAFAGAMADLHVSGVDGEFLDDVSKALKPGRYAIVADVAEEWITPVDTRMEALGGTVHRAARRNVEREQSEREEATARAELASLKAEQAKAHTERKKRLQSRIQELEAKLEATLHRHRQRHEEQQREMDAKLTAVQQRAAKAQGEAKAALEARIAELRREYEGNQPKPAPAGAGASPH